MFSYIKPFPQGNLFQVCTCSYVSLYSADAPYSITALMGPFHWFSLFWYYKQCCNEYLCNTSWNTWISLSDKFLKVEFLGQRLCSPWLIISLCPSGSLNQFRLPPTLRVGLFSHTLTNRVFPDIQSWCGFISLFIKIIHVYYCQVLSWAQECGN